MHYRLATIADLPTLNQISFTAKQHWGYPAEWMEYWREGLRLTEQHLQQLRVVVAEYKQEVAGFCALAYAETYNEVEHLWILPKHMGKGFGKQLLTHTLEHYAANELPVRVIADPNAEGFYAKYGFVTFAQEESYPPGRFLPIMRRAAVEIL